jgi:hypothetical protein
MNIQLWHNQSQYSHEIELKRTFMTLKDRLKYKLTIKT